jgi:hypothetical protein
MSIFYIALNNIEMYNNQGGADIKTDDKERYDNKELDKDSDTDYETADEFWDRVEINPQEDDWYKRKQREQDDYLNKIDTDHKERDKERKKWLKAERGKIRKENANKFSLNYINEQRKKKKEEKKSKVIQGRIREEIIKKAYKDKLNHKSVISDSELIL